MSHTREIKDSEARILIFLSQVRGEFKSVDMISAKLNIDYSYTIRILKSMVIKGWLFKHPYDNFMFYDLSHFAPVEKAKQVLSTESYQRVLDIAAQSKIEDHVKVSVTSESGGKPDQEKAKEE